MKRLMQITLAAAIVAMAASPALAQQRQGQGAGRGFGGFGGVMLLGQKSVQEELKLSADQTKQIQEFIEKQRANRPDFQGLDREEIQKKLAERTKANNEAIAKILKPEQVKRLKQITLQQQVRVAVASVVNNPELAKDLNITDDQKGKIREIQTKSREEMQGLGRDEEGAKKRQEIRTAMNEKVMGVLTADQKTKLKEMQGAPFTGKIEFGGRRNQQR